MAIVSFLLPRALLRYLLKESHSIRDVFRVGRRCTKSNSTEMGDPLPTTTSEINCAYQCSFTLRDAPCVGYNLEGGNCQYIIGGCYKEINDMASTYYLLRSSTEAPSSPSPSTPVQPSSPPPGTVQSTIPVSDGTQTASPTAAPEDDPDNTVWWVIGGIAVAAVAVAAFFFIKPV